MGLPSEPSLMGPLFVAGSEGRQRQPRERGEWMGWGPGYRDGGGEISRDVSTAQPGLLTLSPASLSIQGLQGPRVSGLGCAGRWWGSGTGQALWVPGPQSSHLYPSMPGSPLSLGLRSAPGAPGGERWKAFDQGLTVLLFLQGPPGPRGRPGPPVGNCVLGAHWTGDGVLLKETQEFGGRRLSWLLLHRTHELLVLHRL